MNVLVACEESQRVTMEFRKMGHNAFSCDVEPESGDFPEWHIQSDVLPLLNGNCSFLTNDGKRHSIEGPWNIIIAHPPCTFLCAASACRMYPERGKVDPIRLRKAMRAKNFFMQIFSANCEKIAIENPKPLKIVELPKEQQHIQPFQFGDPYSKLTYLWLKNLPQLQPTKIIKNYVPYISCGTSRNKGKPDKAGVSRRGGAAKIRSKTFPGIAEAMAAQWGGTELDNYQIALW